MGVRTGSGEKVQTTADADPCFCPCAASCSLSPPHPPPLLYSAHVCVYIHSTFAFTFQQLARYGRMDAHCLGTHRALFSVPTQEDTSVVGPQLKPGGGVERRGGGRGKGREGSGGRKKAD